MTRRSLSALPGYHQAQRIARVAVNAAARGEDNAPALWNLAAMLQHAAYLSQQPIEARHGTRA